jgi:hypothetical protein
MNLGNPVNRIEIVVQTMPCVSSRHCEAQPCADKYAQAEQGCGNPDLHLKIES